MRFHVAVAGFPRGSRRWRFVERALEPGEIVCHNDTAIYNLAFDGGEGNALYGNATYTILDWLSVSGNLGHQWAENAKLVGSRDYTYGDIGATATWKGLALDIRYSGTDLGTAQCGAFYMATRHACSGGVVATITYNFTLLP